MWRNDYRLKLEQFCSVIFDKLTTCEKYLHNYIDTQNVSVQIAHCNFW